VFEIGAEQVGVDEIGTRQDASGEVDAGEGRLAQVDPGQFETGEIVVFEVGPRTAAQAAHEPRVPYEDADQFRRRQCHENPPERFEHNRGNPPTNSSQQASPGTALIDC